MDFTFSLFFWSVFGALFWTTLERIRRRNDLVKRPHRRTWIFSALLGIVLGILVALMYRDPKDLHPELFAGILAYVATDLLNSLFVIVTKKRM